MTTDRQRPQRGCPTKDTAERPTTETTSLGAAWQTESCRGCQPRETKHLPWGLSPSLDPVAQQGGWQTPQPQEVDHVQTQPHAGGHRCLPQHKPSARQWAGLAAGRRGGGGRCGWEEVGNSRGRNGGNRGVCDTTSHAASPLLSWVSPAGQEEDAGRGAKQRRRHLWAGQGAPGCYRHHSRHDVGHVGLSGFVW